MRIYGNQQPEVFSTYFWTWSAWRYWSCNQQFCNTQGAQHYKSSCKETTLLKHSHHVRVTKSETDYLVDYKTKTFELLTPSNTTVDDWLEDDDDEVIIEPDVDESFDEDEITAEPEPGYQTDPNYSNNTNFKKSYENGTPMVPGKVSDDGQKIINKPVTGYQSGIRVETQMGTKHEKGVRQQQRKYNPQPPGIATPFAPKKKKPEDLTDADHSRDGLEVSGSDASQDYVGFSGSEAHFDNLMQQAFESDLRQRGFWPNIFYILILLIDTLLTMTATKSKQSTSTAPKNTNNFGNVRIAAPIYVGVTSELSKEILESLRRKCGSDATSTVMPHTSISVVDSGTTQAQHDLERRLRIDLKTLRMVLFDSWNRGLNLDLALRLQAEVKDDVQFIDRQTVQKAISQSLDHYTYFATNAETS